VPNALSARIAQDVGSEALYLTGAGISNMNFGLPDIGLTGLTDVVTTLQSVRSVTDLPIVVDADTGFGNAVNVYHTVRRLEAAGANAIQLEDQEFPKRCGHFEGKEVIALADMVDKVKAAVDARHDENLQIVARTDARAVEGFEAAIERAQALEAAGADIIFVEAMVDEAELRAVPQRLTKPLILNLVHGGKTPALPLAELDRIGYRCILYANAALQAAMASMHRVLGELNRTGSLEAVAQDLASFSERQRLVGKPEYDAIEKRFATRG
jgi:2-methylisocitrate lyase-like PEP mutase family enzyme